MEIEFFSIDLPKWGKKFFCFLFEAPNSFLENTSAKIINCFYRDFFVRRTLDDYRLLLLE
jgi:hypothetical protein